MRPPRQQDDRCQDSDPSVQGQSLYIIFYALDWIVCFRVILNSMGAIISLFSLVSIFSDLCLHIYLFQIYLETAWWRKSSKLSSEELSPYQERRPL